MHFMLPDGSSFEIPDAWWQETGMRSFVPTNSAYQHTPDPDLPNVNVLVVSLESIAPPKRLVDLDGGGFSKDRLISVFAGFLSSTAMPPIRVMPCSEGKYRYNLYDGFHRFYASVAAGFKNIPVVPYMWGFGE